MDYTNPFELMDRLGDSYYATYISFLDTRNRDIKIGLMPPSAHPAISFHKYGIRLVFDYQTRKLIKIQDIPDDG